MLEQNQTEVIENMDESSGRVLGLFAFIGHIHDHF